MKTLLRPPLSAPLWVALAVSLGALTAHAQAPAVIKGTTAAKPAAVAAAPVAADANTEASTVGPALNLTIGKSTLMRLPSAITRISVGNPTVADVTLISASELYLLGKTYGSTNLMIWRKGAGPTAIDVNVNIDVARMEAKIHELLPGEKGITVRPAADSVILTGVVSSAVKAKAAEDIANAFVSDMNKSLVLPIVAGDTKVAPGTKLQMSSSGSAGGAKVVNLLQIAEAQQVMLEVTVAEVSKTLMDKMGAKFSATRSNGDWMYGIGSNLLSGGAGLLSAIKNSTNGLSIDLEKNDGLIKILAEPNLVAISGQEASFLAGGKIFIPVARANDATGGSTITLEEKEYGVGVKFTPTVLEGGRIHLKVAPEVSELSQTGSPFSTIGGQTAILPSFTTRRAQTSVQLMDGQSLAIAGLIKNNVTQVVDRVPGLGEVPVLGALFRSSEFQGDRSELMFVITPRLIKPLDPNYILPTDSFTPPNRSEFYFGNKLEGSGHEDIPADPRTAPANVAPINATGGMEVK
ncbi:MAG: type II and III secretion system protein family protein [Rhodoferax sp.]|uniref:type II and III secretion system protein family protein n=2 Tax=Rhodoferax sp. TaxID=50421 RepID=UPI002730CE4D|nr:type II and III secretion system protein family protein [Rhodoferax sp.]MDP1527937.1 type II and III secretion system protein family protein [Rhodoferax sp.]MDP1944450.1 type II and III secretion system protein family protein [Rhodoferax sp.]MDP3337015.1 type II and III secretion system protein family protein [Rhodoferax sp.]